MRQLTGRRNYRLTPYRTPNPDRFYLELVWNEELFNFEVQRWGNRTDFAPVLAAQPRNEWQMEGFRRKLEREETATALYGLAAFSDFTDARGPKEMVKNCYNHLQEVAYGLFESGSDQADLPLFSLKHFPALKLVGKRTTAQRAYHHFNWGPLIATFNYRGSYSTEVFLTIGAFERERLKLEGDEDEVHGVCHRMLENTLQDDPLRTELAAAELAARWPELKEVSLSLKA